MMFRLTSYLAAAVLLARRSGRAVRKQQILAVWSMDFGDVNRMYGLSVGIGLTMSLAVASATAAPTARFRGIGEGHQVYEVANNGSKVVGKTGSSSNAGYWTPSTGWTDLGFSGFAYDVSGDGSAIVGWSGSSTNSSPDRNSAFLWTPTAGVEWLGDSAQAMAISADGTTIIGDMISPSGHKESYRWTRAEGMISLRADLGDPNATRARGVSGDGSRITGVYEIGYATLSGNWLWESASPPIDMRVTPTPSPESIYPWAVSADGTTVVGNGSGRKAGIWHEGTGLNLPPNLPGVTGEVSARDVSASGDIVTGYAYLDGQQTAVVWDQTRGMRRLQEVLEQDYGLNLSGWHLQRAYVSDDGHTFAGMAVNPSGRHEAWIAQVPEPSTLALLAMGAFGLIAYGWRRRVR